MSIRPQLIILSGLSETGKTTIARHLSQKLGLCYLRVDCVEASFRQHDPDAGSEGEGYQALIHLARENLNIGNSVLIDTVNPMHLTRSWFRELADTCNACFYQFELKVKDIQLHRRRVENRQSDLTGLKVPSWSDVCQRDYDAWDEAMDGPVSVIYTDDGMLALSQCLKILQSPK